MKSLFEQMDSIYRGEKDYLIPNLTLLYEKQVEIDLWGQRHLRYLQEHHKALYYNLLTSGRLNSYLADINKQSEERYELIAEQMKQAQEITEQLKAENIREWTGRTNNVRACATEIVNKEITFAYLKSIQRTINCPIPDFSMMTDFRVLLLQDRPLWK